MPSATDLANYARCSHRVFLDLNGNRAEALLPSAEVQRLWDEGREHEALVMTTLSPAVVAGATPEQRVADTHRLMAEGAPLIYHGLLHHGDLVGEPDILKRVETPSQLGDFSYAPADVKSGRATKSAKTGRIKVEYGIQLCAYAELLEGAQGVRPQAGWIVDRDAEWREVDLTLFAATYAEIRARFAAVQSGTEPTVPGWKTAACPQCGWRDRCWRILVETDDLTTMPAIGIPKREKLWAIGVKTVADLAAADSELLGKTKGLGKVARSWPARARAVKSGTAVLIEPWTPPVVDFEISYDVENLTDPFVYLHGLLIRPTGGRPFGDPRFTSADFGSFEPIIAGPTESEESVWNRFLQKVEQLTRLGSFSVLIYSPHERGVLRRLKAAYGGSEALERFEAAMIDLCKVVKRSVILPTDGDGLKVVAKHIGFKWRDSDPGGSQSIGWWKEYVEDPINNEALRDRVIDYNEDDVRASFAIRDWLLHLGESQSRQR